MDTFPAFIPLTGRKVVVIGEGEAADAKARLFDGSPARIKRMAQITAEGLADAALIFIALPDGPALQDALALARQTRALVNVVDRPELSDFTTPSIIDRGQVVGAIGTDGAAPVLATRLRQQIEALWPGRLGAVARLLKARQTQIRTRFPDLTARRRFLRAVLDGPVAARVLAGDDPGADAAFDQAVAVDTAPMGEVWGLVVGDTPDTLTLGQLRRLGTADRVVLEGEISPAVLAFARRDAPRETQSTPAQRDAWVAAGEVVCVLQREG